MAATETAERRHRPPPCPVPFAAWVSDSLDDVRAWTLVAAVSIGYMISRGLATSGSRHVGGEDPLNRDDR